MNADAAPVTPLDPGPSVEPSRERRPASPPKECIHCGLSLGPHHKEEDGPFCCAGCRTVHALIHEQGLGRYYDLKRCATAPPPSLRPDTFAWLPSVIEAAPAVGSSSVRRLRLDVQGVHCAACVWLLEQLFVRHEGGRGLRINPALGTVDVLWDVAVEPLQEYLAEVESFGYRFGPPRKAEGDSRDLQIRMGICIAAAVNTMLFSLAFYVGLAPSDGLVYVLFGRLNLALASLAVVVGGWPFLRGAFLALRRRVAHLDMPIALGMVLAFLGSSYSYLTAGPEAAYFDTITIFIALMLVGRWLQERVLERNRNELLASAGIADLYTRRFQGDEIETVSASEVRQNDTLWIAPGDLVPVEGILLRAPATVSLDWITGEAAPLTVAAGEAIAAGAFNAGDLGFRLHAREDFSASRLHDLMAASRSQDERASVAELRRGWWHKVATLYVVAVLTLAAAGFLAWLGEGLRHAVEVSVAILVVTCPCALGLAVPLGRELTHAGLRRGGVLLRRDGFLDRALTVRQVVFDKTGTLTRGRLRLTQVARRTLLGLSATQRTILGNMAARSSHPVSRCVAAALGLSRVAAHGRREPSYSLLDDADQVREVVGEGLLWVHEGVEYRFGKAGFALGVTHEDDAEDSPHALFTASGQVLAELEFDEDIRDDVADEVARLKMAGYQVHLLSGDDQDKVSAVAQQVGIPARHAWGELSPEEKAEAVARLDHRDTLMVGDGLNDSMSFDVALCSATPAVDRAVMPQKADFYFLGDGIAAVRAALAAARRLRRVQRDNLIFAVVYNLGAVALCMAGWVNPVVAAILMPLSSIAVVSHTTGRLRRKGAVWTS